MSPGISLSTSVHYKPTDSQSHLFHSSSHPLHVKNSIPYSLFLRLWCFVVTTLTSLPSQKKCANFQRLWLSCFCCEWGLDGTQKISQHTALQMSQRSKEEKILFTLNYHPNSHATKKIISINFKLLTLKQEEFFTQPPLMSFKCETNPCNCLVKSSLKSDKESGTFKCSSMQCNTFVHNTVNVSGLKHSIKITDCFDCPSSNVITFTLHSVQNALHW